ncbi:MULTISPECIES: hypothetical protein [Elizabethkingia]|uniref:hypothetical protein n=1 Tax=Elizabethkingia TaxID=308865 RepID=UPI0021A7B2ED|nr:MULTISPECIES: hypothetical protein [Elizabethkingia]MCT3689545.1 hypothetical protein [Elizabethkingia anophelis]MCT3706366.1 hypothetical protein [Elizabethkingia anophelis]MCT3713385.1 hypothetical protein [Elizabethkingia anophelis]MCT3716803.1 hypothetical protein [Elizabethkingia anophelis]MCT3730438.1 hypothetical protein [Elizabethkingia anophelis]
MKTLEKIKDEVAEELGYVTWSNMIHLYGSVQTSIVDKVAKLYAREVAQDSLQKAAENAELGVVKCEDCKCQSNFCTDNIGILKESITNPNNITLL